MLCVQQRASGRWFAVHPAELSLPACRADTRRRVGSGSGVPPPCPPHPMLGCLWAVCSRDLLSGCSPPRLEMFPPRVLAGSCELPLPAVLGDGWWLLGLRWLMGTRAQSSAWGGGAGWLWWDRASCAEHRVLPAVPRTLQSVQSFTLLVLDSSLQRNSL